MSSFARNCLWSGWLIGWCVVQVQAADTAWPRVNKVERQPLVAATERLVQALDFVGSPLPA